MHDKEYGVVEQYTKRNKNRSIWQRFVRMLACVVVFCTTYALILPVITMEQNYFCGMEDHTHGEACYGYSQSAEETCSAKLLGVHTHVGGCYDEAGNNLCGYSDKLIHTHDAQCYDTEGNLWCLLAEVEEHAHTDACYTTTADVLICQVEETEGHAHGDGCYDDEGALVCTLEEQEGHTHAESCYEPGQQAVVCGNSEYVPHTHTDDCKEGNVLICGVQEVLVHQHTEACVPNLEKVLTCQLPEHIHTNVCSIDPNAETEEPHVTEPTQEVTEAPTEGETEGETQVPTEGETQEPTEGETEEGTEAPTEGETEGETEEATTEPIMMMAAGPKDYTLKTMNPDKLEKGQSYVIYYKNGNNCYILNANANKPGVTTVDVGNTNTPTTVDGTWTLKTSNLNNITWTVEQGTTNNGMWLLANAYDDEGYAGGEYLCLNGSTVQTWNNTGKINFELRNVNGAGAQLYSTQENRYLNFYRNAWSGNNNSGVQIYFALPVAAEDNDASDDDSDEIQQVGNYPHAVHTGTIEVDSLRFYNFCIDSKGTNITHLANCVFEITGPNGQSFTMTSGTDSELRISQDAIKAAGGAGNYTIKQTSVPNGYIFDEVSERTFTVKLNNNGEYVFTSGKNIGIFLNHSSSGVEVGKTAEVEDYNSRIYEIMLQAKASVELYDTDPIDVLFVVDQSNSMLFPSGLKSTGRNVTLQKNSQQNATNMENLGLDKSKVYYIIADPQYTSTVFAIWHNGTTWMYQDASYYAKAKHDNAEGYRQDNELAAFPSVGAFQGSWTGSDGKNYKANGGALGQDLGSSKLGQDIGNGSKQYTVYESVDEYNRLHYLEESIANAIYQLSDANIENTATLIRFTKDTDHNDCIGPLALTPENAEKLVDAVNKIQTDGGTRQDIALEHAYAHLTGAVSGGDKPIDDTTPTYTILITDGAPVRSGSDAPSMDTIYSQIRSQATKVRGKSTLITIGLGMGAVEGGGEVLTDIASAAMYANMLEDASGLTDLLHDLLFSALIPKGTKAQTGDIIDVISDSFYPVAWTGSENSKSWVILKEGEWITLSGKYVGANQGSEGAGQLLVDKNGDYYIKWANRKLGDANQSWKGSVFVKAKEDFIGGNAIDTNKSASVSIGASVLQLATPTVNVHLLDMNQTNSEVTVFLGDQINEASHSPIDALKAFYNQTKFEKLWNDQAGLEAVMNAVASANGLNSDSFYLNYALGRDLTAQEWDTLTSGGTITVEYTYDDASSHGPVGYFTFSLEKTGASADYNTHEATVAGEAVETYTLNVTYTAYELGDQGRPDETVNNGTAGPGHEVRDEVQSKDLNDGYGIVDKDNVHIVNVIEGVVEVTKRITNHLVSNVDQTFTFTLHREEDGEDTTHDQILTVTVPAGQTTGTAQVGHLKRGTWILTENPGENYNVQSVTILDTTNCHSNNNETPAAVFHIGNDEADVNVIGKVDGAAYTSYLGAPNGVFGAAEVVNEETTHYREIPVTKAWSGKADSVDGEAVYVILYRNDQIVLDSEGRAIILRLDASSEWTGSFRVAVEESEVDTPIKDLGYTVKEATEVMASEAEGWNAAILENDGTTVVYYKAAAEADEAVKISNVTYIVSYQIDEATGALTVTNSQAYSLPETGGMGTHQYTIGGWLLITAAALMYGYSRRRKDERGADA